MDNIGKIVLVGFMGTGKSSIAREIAHALKCPQLDTDQMIVEREGMSINKIFEVRGEEYFRSLETQVLKEILKCKDTLSVISLGGGTPTRLENHEIIKQLGYVVWLYTPPEETYQRVRGNNDRPLLQGVDQKERIHTLMAERKPMYEAVSNIMINTSNLTISEISTGIIDSASYFFSE